MFTYMSVMNDGFLANLNKLVGVTIYGGDVAGMMPST